MSVQRITENLSRIVILLLALFIWLLPGSPASAQEQLPPPVLRFEQISLQDGLSQSSVYAILQDSYGFLWFGTEGGLNKYDGYQFTIYKHDPDDSTSLSNNIVTALVEDQQGVLWVGTNSGLDRFDRETGTFSHYLYNPEDPSSTSNIIVSALLEDRIGDLWIGTSGGGLNRFDRETGSFQNFRKDPNNPLSLAGNTVEALYEDRSGTLWVGTDGGLDRFDRDTQTFTHYGGRSRNPANPNSSLVLSIYEDSLGDLWVGTNGEGLDRFNRTQQTWTHYANDPRDPFSLSGGIVWGTLEDRAGRLWIGTDGGGLNLFDRQNNRFYPYRHNPNQLDSLSRDAVRSLYEDRSGVFWVGTYGGGLSKSNHNVVKFNLYRQEPGLPNSLSDNYIWSIAEDSEGVLWLGTFQGGLNRFDRAAGEVTVYQHDPQKLDSLSGNDVRAVLVDSRGGVWAGTSAQGLNYFDPQTERFTQYHHDPNNPDSLIADQIRALFEDNDGYLWVGTYANGLDRFDPETQSFTHFVHDPNRPDSLLNNRVRSIFQSRDGSLWIGSSGGVSVMDPASGSFTNYTTNPEDPDALSHSTVFDIFEDAEGTVWIATFGGGLNRFDRQTQTFSHYTEASGLPHNQVYNILADSQGYLWLSTNNGISRFDPRTEEFRNYGIQDGLQNIEFNLGAAYRSSSGEMFFGGIDGLNAFFPEEVKDNSFITPVVITAFQKFNQTVMTELLSGEEIQLSYRDNFFSFEFAALDYTAPSKNQYSYQLEGFDPDWIDAGTRRYASYTNLNGGNYNFRVRGSNSDGVWNETGVTIPIVITPPFWETWWFTLLSVVFVSGSVAGVFVLRARNFEQQKQRLEFQVAQRTEEIERRRRVAESLRGILGVLNSNQPLNEMLDFIAEQTVRLVDCNGIAIYRLQPEDQILTIQASIGLEPHFIDDLAVPLGEGVSGTALQTRQLIVIDDTQDSDQELRLEGINPENRELLESIARKYRSILSAPLVVQGEPYGTITVYYTQPRQFSQEEIDLVVTIAEQTVLALETARLRDQAGEIAASAERSRLARDLHDSVTQTLFAANLIGDSLPIIWERNPDDGRQRLVELGRLNRGALAEMRSLLIELRPNALLEAEMKDLLRYLSEAFSGRTHVPVEVKINSEKDLSKYMPADVKVAFYRIAQEALNNIAKHARASQVTVAVQCDKDKIGMSVEDDGHGFDPETITGDHFGLGIMKERADNIGAQLTVWSEVGKGSRVEVAWQSGGMNGK